ncbi:hypothetical protein [Nostoc sp.]|uniref:hypothetical protein n=1 Tax=Nostoc sp. TaxID=1180 RepID=UPI002FF6A8A9
MNYCKIGDSPKVTYQFSDREPIIYQSNVAPIEVFTGTAPPEGTTTNYNPQGYQISFLSPQSFSGRFTQIVLDYKTRVGNIGTFFEPQTGLFVKFIACDATTFGTIEITCSGQITIDNNIHCPVAALGDKCQIIISNGGQQLFQAKGKCPVSFTVSCGNCPEGQCECHSDSYPGYCCLDCGAVASNIRTITNELKEKNGR